MREARGRYALPGAELLRRAEAMPGRYRTRCLRVAGLADGAAANPFESVLRAVAWRFPASR
ncbi:hypothetical protein KRR39_22795 [Nocardioides panacis]|uniref:Uncharacterized protein n=1 Tax=Nocardioides panacis TaxID=2849501 RepID=A0A975SYE0_9ACTN|nr:hypothetical protein [Nocardioides panacis]QWZ08131.1 hypothetical protein KRR39_22795 [Nocardioides panacis]